jgi:hypothetical protein
MQSFLRGLLPPARSLSHPRLNRIIDALLGIPPDLALFLVTAIWFRFSERRPGRWHGGGILPRDSQETTSSPNTIWPDLTLFAASTFGFRFVRRRFGRSNGTISRPRTTIQGVLETILGISPDLALFLGTALWFRFWRRRSGGSDRGGNLRTGDPTDEAELYQQKKERGFKDPSLYNFIDTCVETKKTLRKVEDPENARKEKLKTIRQAQQAKPRGPLGLSPDCLKNSREGLRPIDLKIKVLAPSCTEDKVARG